MVEVYQTWSLKAVGMNLGMTKCAVACGGWDAGGEKGVPGAREKGAWRWGERGPWSWG